MSDDRKQNGHSDQDSSKIKQVELSGADARAKLAELMGSLTTGSTTEPQEKEFKFWKTQPVPQLDAAKELEALGDHGQAIEERTVDQVSKKPLNLIESFEWSEIDVQDDAQLEETYRLLNENYVEDGDATFRFDYSRDFLRWALLPPGYQPSWHIGVRVKSNKKLVAFVTAIPATISIHQDAINMVEINFLCVHKKLRGKRLAPVMIREITRRVNLQGIWQAAYTAGAVLPTPVSSAKYWHRSLNPKKLVEVGFSRLQPRMTMARTIRLYTVKSETATPGIRKMRKEDVPAARKLLMEYFEQFDMHVHLSEEEFEHWLLPREGVIYTYVVEDPDTKEITDLTSFYSLPSTIIKHPTHKTLNAAYAYCYASFKTPLVKLVQDALVLARRNDFDVFNALELARNQEYLKELKFHIGDGELHYYLYNWKCRPVPQEKNALVLL